jgi:hemoglobin
MSFADVGSGGGVLAIALLLGLTGCTRVEGLDGAATPPVDGTLATPADYRSWPMFLADIQRPDARQVRDIYVNPAGYAAQAGSPFPSGTKFVMELYAARTAADGSLLRDDEGKLVKGELLKLFVMGKGPGWSASVAPELRTGDWIYAAWLPDRTTPAPDALAGCRGCHLPQVTADYVHRAAEFFAQPRG